MTTISKLGQLESNIHTLKIKDSGIEVPDIVQTGVQKTSNNSIVKYNTFNDEIGRLGRKIDDEDDKINMAIEALGTVVVNNDKASKERDTQVLVDAKAYTDAKVGSGQIGNIIDGDLTVKGSINVKGPNAISSIDHPGQGIEFRDTGTGGSITNINGARDGDGYVAIRPKGGSGARLYFSDYGSDDGGVTVSGISWPNDPRAAANKKYVDQAFSKVHAVWDLRLAEHNWSYSMNIPGIGYINIRKDTDESIKLGVTVQKNTIRGIRTDFDTRHVFSVLPGEGTQFFDSPMELDTPETLILTIDGRVIDIWMWYNNEEDGAIYIQTFELGVSKIAPAKSYDFITGEEV